MPFIVKWPNVVPANSISDQLLCFTDLMATFAAITRTELQEEAGPDSFSFLAALTGENSSPPRTSLLMKTSNGMLTARRGPWKLIDGLGSGGFSEPKRIKPGPHDPVGQLYNLDQDRDETHNLYLQEPAIVAELNAVMQDIQDHPVSRPVIGTH